jgi:hypothetical protein
MAAQVEHRLLNSRNPLVVLPLIVLPLIILALLALFGLRRIKPSSGRPGGGHYRHGSQERQASGWSQWTAKQPPGMKRPPSRDDSIKGRGAGRVKVRRTNKRACGLPCTAEPEPRMAAVGALGRAWPLSAARGRSWRLAYDRSSVSWCLAPVGPCTFSVPPLFGPTWPLNEAPGGKLDRARVRRPRRLCRLEREKQTWSILMAVFSGTS